MEKSVKDTVKGYYGELKTMFNDIVDGPVGEMGTSYVQDFTIGNNKYSLEGEDDIIVLVHNGDSTNLNSFGDLVNAIQDDNPSKAKSKFNFKRRPVIPGRAPSPDQPQGAVKEVISLIVRKAIGSIKEGKEKSTCCHLCGHKHVKGTPHPKPYLRGKKSCKYRD
jgi:hypothetical protein